jgi:hypothetical protein
VHNSSISPSALAGAGLLLGVSGLSAGGTGPWLAHASVPAVDRWMYPNNSTPGARPTASTFSFLPFTGADDRFGQFVIKFDTVTMGIPAGLGPSNYEVHRLKLTCVYQSPDPIPYDPTEDPRASLGPSATVPDVDAGRPLELHGTGFRGGFTAATFLENSSFGARNAFASSFDGSGVARDVSNNVTLGYESYPWAIGKASVVVSPNTSPPTYGPLAAGAIIPVYAHITFEVDLAIPSVADSIRQGLHQGFLWFTLSSFHPVSGPGSGGFPAYHTKEHPEQALYGDVAPTLDVEYSLPLRVATFERPSSGNDVFLSWNGSPGFTYSVERTDDLASGAWSEGGAITTLTPAILTWSGMASSSRGFFRISRTKLP